MKTQNTTPLQKSEMRNLLFVILAFVLLIFVVSANAQTDGKQTPKRGFSPGNSYSLGDFEIINTTNGNVMIRFPLGNLPTGRNGLSAGLTLTYNSKLFDSETAYFRNEAYQCKEIPGPNEYYYISCPYYTKQLLKPSAEGGWHYSSGFQLKTEDRRTQFTNVPVSEQPQCRDIYGGVLPGYNMMTYVHKLFVVFPDGSQHQMIPYGYNDANQDRYYSVRPNGIIENCGGNTSEASTPLTYYSVDGTFLRLEYDSNNHPTLYFSDGSRYDFGVSNNPPRMYDRNNNYVEFGQGQITDQFGRSIVTGYDSSTNEETITVKGVGGESLVWRVKWKQIVVHKQYNANPENLAGCGQTNSCPPDTDPELLSEVVTVIDKITLPSQAGNNLSYTFNYNAAGWTGQIPSQQTYGFGELSGVTLPSGASANYDYYLNGETVPVELRYTKEVLKNRITSKTLTVNQEYDATTTPVTQTWSYDIQPTGSSVTAPDGGTSSESFNNTEFPNWKSGLTLSSIAPDGTKVEKLWGQNRPVLCNGTIYCDQYATNTYIEAEFISIKDSNGNYTLTAIKDYSYDKNGNVTQVAEYDWLPYQSIPRDGELNGNYPTGIPSGATPKRITVTNYFASTPDASQLTWDGNLYIWRTSPKLKNTVSWNEVRNGSNQAVTRNEMIYDDPYTTGNLTEAKSWDSTKSAYSNPLTTTNSISVSTTYNQYGMPTLITDARATQTQITYGTITTPTGTVTDLYPTETKSGYGTSIVKTARMEYDFFTGAVTKAIDVDNNIWSTTAYDALARPTLTKSAEGTSVETRTQTIYNDVERRVIVKSDLNTTGDGKLVSIQHYDQMGRVRLTRTLEDSTTQNATNEQDGIKVQTRYLYSGNYSYTIASNPYRAGTSSQATNEVTMGWTRSKTINTGKRQEIETFSGATLPAPFGSNTNSTGVVKTETDADRVLVTDQSGKQRISKTNALGQLTDVFEVTAEDSNTVAISFPNSSVAHAYQTSYQYDTLSNLTQVNQGVQTRNFSYSSLSGLLSAANPESGTISYTYDAGGNLLSKTDAGNIRTNYSYDQLNRVLTRSYQLCPSGQNCQSEGTPSTTYTYDDASAAFGKGKLTKVNNGVSETKYTSFDALGKVLSNQQTTDGQTYSMSYSYNIAGALTSQTYPSGRVVTNTLDTDGSLANVSSKATSTATPRTYANAFRYNASGAVSSMRLGNGKFESTVFNTRLQPTQIALGTSANNTSLLKLNYDYGTTDNNGNVKSQTITVAGMSHPLIQTYNYDSLNRLQSAEEKSNNIPQWKQTFTFDRYGNRRFDMANTTMPDSQSNQNITNPQIDPSNNRFSANQGYEYDSAGNVTKDAANKRFIYDAENKQTSFGTNGSNTNGGTYFYDGDGKRIKKIVGSETTIFVYNASGQLVAEYSTTTQTNPTISYLTTDTLGTPRINTDANGQVLARHDYMPFGEEIIGLGNRQSTNGYQTDNIRQKFTSYERDTESGLDFAKARYHSSNLGRFQSPDPVLISKLRIRNPQIWNSYSYAGNNPLRYTDPDGLEKIALGDDEKTIKKDIEAKKAERKAIDKDKTLTKQQKEQKKAEINGQLKTLETKLDGTRLVNELLKDLDSVGQRNGLQLSDFSLTTDPQADFAGDSNMSTIMSSQAFHRGGEIYIRADAACGQLCFYNAINSQGNTDIRNGFLHVASAILAHEQYHQLNPNDRREKPAYQREKDVFEKFEKKFNDRNRETYDKNLKEINDAINSFP